jgi:hypothetical protein
VHLYTWLADEGGSDAMPDAASGEGGRGAAKLERVIHRHLFNRYRIAVAHEFMSQQMKFAIIFLTHVV